MIKGIDKILCINCGLCEDICPTDVFRRKNRKIYIAYQDDCCNCMDCFFVCPTEAITLAAGVPRKFDVRLRWKQIKEGLYPASVGIRGKMEGKN
jgi:NAD-dependent dihydropyrimidine dehydrogenase PreA subunit